jgi:hypothetical protein
MVSRRLLIDACPCRALPLPTPATNDDDDRDPRRCASAAGGATRDSSPDLTTALALLALPVPRVLAHEGGNGISVRAPLDAVDCTTTRPTITVLGLTIDVGTATIDGGDDGEEDLVARDDEKDDDDGGDGGAGGCAALVVGQPVRVVLARDTLPLVATPYE